MHRVIWMLVTFVGVSGAGFAQTQDLILPVVVNGYVVPPIHYQTTIRIVNLTANPVQVTLEAYRDDGTAVRILELFPVARTGTKTLLNIDGFGSLEAFTAEDVPDLNGWVRLTYKLVTLTGRQAFLVGTVTSLQSVFCFRNCSLS